MDNSQLIGKLHKYKTANTKKYKPNTFVLDVTNPRERFALWVDKNGDSELLFSENGLKFECKVIKRNGHEDEWMWFPTACSEYCDHIVILGDNEELYLKLLKIFDVHDLIAHPLALFRELLDLNPEADAEMLTTTFDKLKLQETAHNQNLVKTVSMPHDHIQAFMRIAEHCSLESYKEYIRNNFSAAEMLMYAPVIKCCSRFTDKETIKYMHKTFDVENMSRLVNQYTDYLRMRNQLPPEVRGNFPKFPPVFNEQVHDNIMDEYRRQESKPLGERYQPLYEEVYPKAAKYSYEHGDYIIFPPKEVVDLVNEGNKLRHCVGSYVASVATGQEYILYLRKKSEPDVPYFTVNVDTNNKVRQIHGLCNCNLPDELRPIVDAWAKKFGLDASNCDGIRCHL